jgi:hypothetical protein
MSQTSGLGRPANPLHGRLRGARGRLALATLAALLIPPARRTSASAAQVIT